MFPRATKIFGTSLAWTCVWFWCWMFYHVPLRIEGLRDFLAYVSVEIGLEGFKRGASKVNITPSMVHRTVGDPVGMARTWDSLRWRENHISCRIYSRLLFWGLFIVVFFLAHGLDLFFWVPASLLFLLLCFFDSVLFCSLRLLFLCFSASLLSLLVCFPAFVFPCLSTSTIQFYFLFSSVMCFAALLPAPLLLCFLSLLSLCCSCSFALFFPVCILNETMERHLVNP